MRRLTLFLDPTVELIARLDVDAQKHLGVLGSAILCALPQVKTGLMWVDPRAIDTVGNQVGLAGKTGNPEAVIRIRGKQSDECRCRMTGSLTGTCNSLAVTTFSPGYRNSHQN